MITDTERNVKMSIRHPLLNPARFAILDPLALTSAPMHVAAHAGADAFVHAFESFINKNANLFSDGSNLRSIELISASIGLFVADRTQTDAGLKMLLGSALAATGFSQTGTGNVHCIARFIGAEYHVSHGLSNALLLPSVAKFNSLACPSKYRQVAIAMGIDVSKMTLVQSSDAAVHAITRMVRDIGIPDGLRHVGVKESDIDALAETCFKNNYNQWNPRTTSKEDFRSILINAF